MKSALSGNAGARQEDPQGFCRPRRSAPPEPGHGRRPGHPWPRLQRREKTSLSRQPEPEVGIRDFLCVSLGWSACRGGGPTGRWGAAAVCQVTPGPTKWETPFRARESAVGRSMVSPVLGGQDSPRRYACPGL